MYRRWCRCIPKYTALQAQFCYTYHLSSSVLCRTALTSQVKQMRLFTLKYYNYVSSKYNTFFRFFSFRYVTKKEHIWLLFCHPQSLTLIYDDKFNGTLQSSKYEGYCCHVFLRPLPWLLNIHDGGFWRKDNHKAVMAASMGKRCSGKCNDYQALYHPLFVEWTLIN